MLNKYLKYICVVIFVFLLYLPKDAVFAARSNSRQTERIEAIDPVREATVNLSCRLRDENRILTTSGSGVFVSPRGVILTNAHVAQYFILAKARGFKGRCYVRTGSPAKSTYTAEILYFPVSWLEENVSKISEKNPKGTGRNDFALLHITGAKEKKKGKLPESFPAVNLNYSELFERESPVTAAGYPMPDSHEEDSRARLIKAQASIANIASFDGKTADVLTISPSKVARDGDSGGPILNQANELIGIVTTKGSSENPSLRAITIPYIDRSIYSQIGLSLPALIQSDFGAMSASSKAGIPKELIAELASGLRKKKE